MQENCPDINILLQIEVNDDIIEELSFVQAEEILIGDGDATSLGRWWECEEPAGSTKTHMVDRRTVTSFSKLGSNL